MYSQFNSIIMGKEIFKNVNFSLAEKVLMLGKREKNAVKEVLNGLRKTLEEQREQKPMKITITENKKFDMDNFNIVMQEMGIDISSSLKEESDSSTQVKTFLPKPEINSKFPIMEIISSRRITDQFIESFLNYEPSPTNSKPQK